MTYRAGDITDLSAIGELLEEIKPRVIFHAASPRHAEFSVKDQEFLDTNVKGTQNLLANAIAVSSVKAFVFTSSVSVLAGEEHILMDETQPLWQEHSHATPYEISKSIADTMVRESNCQKLRTICLRLCVVLGERDNSYVPLWMDAPTNVQIGDNRNVIHYICIENAVTAHVLAAKALLDCSLASGKVDGEAFNFTDASQIPFWDLSRMIWDATGHTTPIENVRVIPARIALIMAGVAEWVFWLFTLGQKKPQNLNKLVVTYCIRSHTYCIDKARTILHYEPVPNRLEDSLRASVEWEMKQRAAKQQELKKK